MIITIDGPAASGKSTVSRLLAQKLDYYYLCSGLLYRAVGYLLTHYFHYTTETIHTPLQKDIDICLNSQKLLYHYSKETGEKIFFESEDITPYLKEKYIDKVSSIISINPCVRAAVTQVQRHIASNYNIVTDGRDVGSIVFPYAEVKFFVTASVEVRANRWKKDQEKYNNYISLDEAINLITDRDNRDKVRTIAPLIIPQDAIIIDTSCLTITQTVDTMLGHINNAQ